MAPTRRKRSGASAQLTLAPAVEAAISLLISGWIASWDALIREPGAKFGIHSSAAHMVVLNNSITTLMPFFNGAVSIPREGRSALARGLWPAMLVTHWARFRSSPGSACELMRPAAIGIR